MIIKKLTLHGYLRFRLNNIETFTITPKEKIQLVLGTNGSGKSSLLRELTPLPAQSSDYKKGGSKVIEIVLGKNEYVLSSDFTSVPKHSFVLNGDELNQSGTMSIQKTLVSEHFGLTQDLHEIMISLTGFCTMSSMERRKWFTRFSNNDYTFALNIYNKIKTAARDISGSIKVIDSRLVTESRNIISEEQLEIIRKNADKLKKTIETLNKSKRNLDSRHFSAARTISQLENQLEENTKQINRLYKSMGVTPTGNNEEAINKDYNESMAEYLYLEKKLTELVTEHDSLDKDYQSFRSDVDKDTLIKDISAINDSLNELEKGIEQSLLTVDADTSLRTLMSIEDSIINCISSIKDNPSYVNNKEDIREINETVDTLKGNVDTLSLRKSRIHNYIDSQNELLKTEDLTCPKCDYKWKLGYDEIKLAKAKEALIKVDEEVLNLTKKLSEITIKQQELLKLNYDLRQLSELSSRFPVLRPLWDVITENIRDNADKSTNYVFIYKDKLLSLQKYQRLSADKERMDATLKIIEQQDNKQKEQLKKKIEDLDYQISSLSKRKSLVSKLVDFYKNKLVSVRELISLGNKTEEAIKQRDEEYMRLFDVEWNTIIDKTAMEYMEPLVEMEKTISSQDKIINVIENMKEQKEELKNKFNTLTIAEKALSPKDGIIAVALVGFVNFVLKQMNVFIEKVWSYPLEISLASVSEEDDTELDYKFGLYVGEDRSYISDISKASSAMREIIDLAFKIVTMKYFGLSQYPLYLDEFGSSFDTGHRLAAAGVISDLMQSDQFSQLFIVSHYEESYGSLTNSEICLLSGTNIVIPKNSVFNSHVEIINQ